MSRAHDLHQCSNFVNVFLYSVCHFSISSLLSFSIESATAMEHPLVQFGGIFLIRNIPKVVLVVAIYIALKSSVLKLINHPCISENRDTVGTFLDECEK